MSENTATSGYEYLLTCDCADHNDVPFDSLPRAQRFALTITDCAPRILRRAIGPWESIPSVESEVTADAL